VTFGETRSDSAGGRPALVAAWTDGRYAHAHRAGHTASTKLEQDEADRRRLLGVRLRSATPFWVPTSLDCDTPSPFPGESLNRDTHAYGGRVGGSTTDRCLAATAREPVPDSGRRRPQAADAAAGSWRSADHGAQRHLTVAPAGNWPGFLAGQSVRCAVEAGRNLAGWPYSPASSQHSADGRIEFTVTRRGLVSEYLTTSSRKGMTMLLGPADGEFCCCAPAEPGAISAGSGITRDVHAAHAAGRGHDGTDLPALLPRRAGPALPRGA